METKATCQCEEISEEEKLKLIDEVLEDYKYEENNLIQILHMSQGIYGFLPISLQKYIAGKMDLPLAKVSGVVSFYALFSTQKKGEYVVKVCLGTACYVRGGKKIIAKLKSILNIDVGQTSEDNKYTLEITRCIGACGLAPAMVINDHVYTQVNPDKLLDILDELE